MKKTTCDSTPVRKWSGRKQRDERLWRSGVVTNWGDPTCLHGLLDVKALCAMEMRRSLGLGLQNQPGIFRVRLCTYREAGKQSHYHSPIFSTEIIEINVVNKITKWEIKCLYQYFCCMIFSCLCWNWVVSEIVKKIRLLWLNEIYLLLFIVIIVSFFCFSFRSLEKSPERVSRARLDNIISNEQFS